MIGGLNDILQIKIAVHTSNFIGQSTSFNYYGAANNSESHTKAQRLGFISSCSQTLFTDALAQAPSLEPRRPSLSPKTQVMNPELVVELDDWDTRGALLVPLLRDDFRLNIVGCSGSSCLH